MLKNHDEEVIRLIAKSNMKGNKTRNVLAVLAIILTTFMFTTVFTIGCSLAENMSIMMIREQGGRSSVFLPLPSQEQINKAQKADALDVAGIRIHVDDIISDTSGRITMDYYDKAEFEENYLPAISDVKGRYPVKEQEVMLSVSALE